MRQAEQVHVGAVVAGVADLAARQEGLLPAQAAERQRLARVARRGSSPSPRQRSPGCGAPRAAEGPDPRARATKSRRPPSARPRTTRPERSTLASTGPASRSQPKGRSCGLLAASVTLWRSSSDHGGSQARVVPIPQHNEGRFGVEPEPVHHRRRRRVRLAVPARAGDRWWDAVEVRRKRGVRCAHTHSLVKPT